MVVRNKKQRNGSIYAWVTFDQSEMSLLLGDGGGKILVTAGGGSGEEVGGNRKDTYENMYVSRPASEMILNIRRKFYIAVDRKPKNNNW